MSGKASTMSLQPTLWRPSMPHARRRRAIALVGFFSSLVLCLLKCSCYQYQNAHQNGLALSRSRIMYYAGD